MAHSKINYVLIILMVFTGIFLFSTSCKKKNYQCVCIGTINGVQADTTFKIKNIRKKDAKQTCLEIESSKFPDAECDLENQ